MKSAPIRKRSVLLAAVSLVSIGVGVAAFGAGAPTQPLPSGFSLSLKGSKHDFDYLAGAWTTQQKRLNAVAVTAALGSSIGSAISRAAIPLSSVPFQKS